MRVFTCEQRFSLNTGIIKIVPAGGARCAIRAKKEAPVGVPLGEERDATRRSGGDGRLGAGDALEAAAEVGEVGIQPGKTEGAEDAVDGEGGRHAVAAGRHEGIAELFRDSGGLGIDGVELGAQSGVFIELRHIDHAGDGVGVLGRKGADAFDELEALRSLFHEGLALFGGKVDGEGADPVEDVIQGGHDGIIVGLGQGGGDEILLTHGMWCGWNSVRFVIPGATVPGDARIEACHNFCVLQSVTGEPLWRTAGTK